MPSSDFIAVVLKEDGNNGLGDGRELRGGLVGGLGDDGKVSVGGLRPAVGIVGVR